MERLKIFVFMFVCLFMVFYFAIGLGVFLTGVIQSGHPYHGTFCNRKVTYLGYYTGFGYIAELGCKAGKPMGDR